MQAQLITCLSILAILLFALVVYKQYDLNNHKHEIKVLNEDLDNRNKFNESLIEDIKKHKETINSQQKVLIVRWDNITELNKEKNDLFHDNQEYQTAIKNLTEANSELRLRNLEQFNTINNLNNRIKELVANNDSLILGILHDYVSLAIPNDSIVNTTVKEKPQVKRVVKEKVKVIHASSQVSNTNPTQTIFVKPKKSKKSNVKSND